MTDIYSQTTSSASTPSIDGTGVDEQSGPTLTEIVADTVEAINSSASAVTHPIDPVTFIREPTSSVPFLQGIKDNTGCCECGAYWIPCDKCIGEFNDGFK